MRKCALCSVELKLLNTPTFGLGKLNDGHEICYNCLKSLNTKERNIGLKLKHYSLEDIHDLQFQDRSMKTLKEMKEYKIVCIACGNIRFVPYFDFENDCLNNKSKTFFGNLLTSCGLSSCCLPLGCILGFNSANEVLISKTSEEKLNKYFDLYKVNCCNKCGSGAKNVEVIIHNIK